MYNPEKNITQTLKNILRNVGSAPAHKGLDRLTQSREEKKTKRPNGIEYPRWNPGLGKGDGDGERPNSNKFYFITANSVDSLLQKRAQ